MIQPRYYQDNAVTAIYDYYLSGKAGNPIISMPTASGKSIVIARFLESIFKRWPRQRVLVVTHVKELIQQNYDKFIDAWPHAPAGIYSAGLNQRDSIFPIIFGGIQSMVNRVDEFGYRDLLIVDECHLIPDKEGSDYQKFIAALKVKNPNLKIIGFSATPYRMGKGMLSDGPIFTDICFDLTSMDEFNKLIDEGYLCPLIPRPTDTVLDVTGVKIQGGDFVQNQLQAAVDKDRITYAACQEICYYGQDRKSWLIFASGIEHAKHIAHTLTSFGIDAVAVHSKMPAGERDKALADFKSYALRCVVTNNICTTGFDHPGLDLIGMLRPTASTVLWVQMLGRGTRPCLEMGKVNCLVLDFARNTLRLGPINDPVIPHKKGTKGAGVAPVRICHQCGCYNHARATSCFVCGAKFEPLPKITKHADTKELIRRPELLPSYEVFDVTNVIYNKHIKNGAPPILKVNYLIKGGVKGYTEYICLEHSGEAGKKAKEWWLQRLGAMPPKTTDEALKYVSQLRVPRQIKVDVNSKHQNVSLALF